MYITNELTVVRDLGAHVINKFYRSLSSSQHFKLKKAIRKILTKTQQQNKIKPEIIETRL